MKHKTFSLRLPEDLCDALDAEASQKFRKRNARTQMITSILTERYQNISAPTQPRTARVAGVSHSTATPRTKRKVAETD